MKIVRIIFSALLLLAVFGPGAAQAGLVEFFFPSLRKADTDPSQTLMAPFAEEKVGPQSPEQELPRGHVPMEVANYNTMQVSEWLTVAASEAMTFDKPTQQEALDLTAHYFTRGGREQYMQFLTDNNFFKIIESGKFYIRSFVNGTPTLLNEGVVEGSYRWLFEVPVMVTYMDKAMKNYKNAAPVNQSMTLHVQIGRTIDERPGRDIIIERWSGKLLPAEKK